MEAKFIPSACNDARSALPRISGGTVPLSRLRENRKLPGELPGMLQHSTAPELGEDPQPPITSTVVRNATPEEEMKRIEFRWDEGNLMFCCDCFWNGKLITTFWAFEKAFPMPSERIRIAHPIFEFNLREQA